MIQSDPVCYCVTCLRAVKMTGPSADSHSKAHQTSHSTHIRTQTLRPSACTPCAPCHAPWLTIASSATRISATSSAVPSAAGSKVSLPSISASVSTTRPPVALAMRLQDKTWKMVGSGCTVCTAESVLVTCYHGSNRATPPCQGTKHTPRVWDWPTAYWYREQKSSNSYT